MPEKNITKEKHYKRRNVWGCSQSNERYHLTMNHSRPYIVSEKIERRLVDFECNNQFSNHNSRKNNMEIDGIPGSITQDPLENTVCKIFNSVPNIQCQPEHLEACHRITARSATTIIKFKKER